MTRGFSWPGYLLPVCAGLLAVAGAAQAQTPPVPATQPQAVQGQVTSEAKDDMTGAVVDFAAPPVAVMPPPPAIPVTTVTTVPALPPVSPPVYSPADTAQFYFVGGDFDYGTALFVEPASIDRSNPKSVRLQTMIVSRGPGFLGLTRYERAAQSVDCSDDNREFMRILSWTQFQENGTIVEQKARPGHIREAIPGKVDRKLWQLACHPDTAPADGKTVTGVTAALGLYDPLQEQEDDLLYNNHVPSKADDPGRALYLETRHKELAATSVDDLRPLLSDYTSAADQGSRQAMWRMAVLSTILKIPGGNDTWSRRLADAGDAFAQYIMAVHLRSNTPCDEARTYLQRSADQGQVKALLGMGAFFENGICGAKDPAQAVVWYEKAARQGDFNGQFQLGYMYENSVGVKRSASESAAWYVLAMGHSPWEPGVDEYRAELGMDHLRQGSFGLGDYRQRASQLCLQDKVCSLVVIKDFNDTSK